MLFSTLRFSSKAQAQNKDINDKIIDIIFTNFFDTYMYISKNMNFKNSPIKK
ncbi:hypothetical protein BHY_1315 (plasmid) [Borrelia nietonii YOR]|uniref:Uncharacterized protein n=2 Tax=Borrelia TaxID=138 RepID=W5SGL1_9SPIR|nr:hypothetical protein BHY_1315 [Borrelia nietonii YOR]AHH14726.1 hypothetical protein BHW_0900055 [Borrelia hermsii MTW]